MEINSQSDTQGKIMETFGESIFEENVIQPDQVFNISYKVNGQKYDVLVQWMGEGRGVKPGNYVFEGDKYSKPKKVVTLSAEELIAMSEDELKDVFPNDADLNPSEATRVIEYIDGFGWNERGVGQTEHAIAISQTVEKIFSK